MSSWEDDNYDLPALGNPPREAWDEETKPAPPDNWEKGPEPSETKSEQTEKPTEIKNEPKKPKKRLFQLELLKQRKKHH